MLQYVNNTDTISPAHTYENRLFVFPAVCVQSRRPVVTLPAFARASLTTYCVLSLWTLLKLLLYFLYLLILLRLQASQPSRTTSSLRR